jgi:hypothetical protein
MRHHFKLSPSQVRILMAEDVTFAMAAVCTESRFNYTRESKTGWTEGSAVLEHYLLLAYR